MILTVYAFTSFFEATIGTINGSCKADFSKNNHCSGHQMLKQRKCTEISTVFIFFQSAALVSLKFHHNFSKFVKNLGSLSTVVGVD